jgi:hypothetical protein
MGGGGVFVRRSFKKHYGFPLFWMILEIRGPMLAEILQEVSKMTLSCPNILLGTMFSTPAIKSLGDRPSLCSYDANRTGLVWFCYVHILVLHIKI